MAKVYEIAFQLGGQIAGTFTKSMRGANAQLSDLQKSIGQLNNQSADVGRLQKLQKSVGSLSREFTQAQARAQQLGKELSATTNPTKQQIREFDRARQAAARLKGELGSQRMELSQLRTSMGATGKSTRQLAKEQQELARKTETARKAQSSLQKTMASQQANLQNRSNLRGQMFDAAALAATMAVPIKLAADWEQSLAELNKVANGTPKELKAISSEAQRLAVNTGVARNEIIGAYTAAAQAGFARDEWGKFAETSAKMGVAFDITGDEAGAMLQKWRVGMGLTMAEATDLAAAANHLSNNMESTAADIGNVLIRQGAILKTAGLDSSTSSALASALVATAPSPEIAATAGKNFVLSLVSGASATAKQKSVFDALGMDPETLAAQMQEAPREAITQVLKALQGVDAEVRTSMLTDLFGKESVGGIAPLIDNLANLEKAFGLVGDRAQYANSLEEEFAALQGTTNQQAKKALEGVKALGTGLGAVLLPSINSILSNAAPLALMLADLTERFPMVTTVVVGGTAALIALKVATIAGAYAFTFIKGGALTLLTVMKTLRIAWLLNTGAIAANTATSKAAIVVSKAMAAAQWLFNAAMTANPIGLVIVGIAALIAAGVALYKNWDAVTAAAGRMWGFIKSGAQAAVSFLSNLFFNFHPLGLLIKNFDAIKAWMSNFSLFQSGAKIMSTIGAGIMSKANAIVDSVKNTFKKVRAYMPFSDAKIGPLSDLTKSGAAIMSTMASGVNKSPELEQAINRQFGRSANAGGLSSGFKGGSSASGAGGGGGITVQLTQEIHVNGGGGGNVRDQARQGAREGVSNLRGMLEDLMTNERRLSYE